MMEDPTMTGKPEEVPNNGKTDQKEQESNTDEKTDANDVAKDA